jgi:hypothetical protein
MFREGSRTIHQFAAVDQPNASVPLTASCGVWLAKGDVMQAGPEAERFLELALATAERTWQALAAPAVRAIVDLSR